MGDDHERSFEIAGTVVEPGSSADIHLVATQSYSARDVVVPIRVIRAAKPGPAVFVTAAVHGDEVNGTGVIRALMAQPFPLAAGTLVLVPVVNVLGFENHTRYFPDRRDLNRCFPGRPKGSLASRFAHAVFSGVIARCDFGIDLHTAAVRRTNFPNVRADMEDERTARIAAAFGCSLVINKRGAKGTLRREASRAGCPTILFEAGEIWKLEPAIIETGVAGVRNVLVELGMVKGKVTGPPFLVRSDRTTWIRSDVGGLLDFHIAPGDLVKARQPVASVTDLFGNERAVLRASKGGLAMGFTTAPSVQPGDPVCHLAIPKGGLARIRRSLEGLDDDSLHERVRDDLSSSIAVTDRD